MLTSTTTLGQNGLGSIGNERILTSTTTPGQSELGINGDEGISATQESLSDEV